MITSTWWIDSWAEDVAASVQLCDQTKSTKELLCSWATPRGIKYNWGLGNHNNIASMLSRDGSSYTCHPEQNNSPWSCLCMCKRLASYHPLKRPALHPFAIFQPFGFVVSAFEHKRPCWESALENFPPPTYRYQCIRRNLSVRVPALCYGFVKPRAKRSNRVV